MRFKKQLRDRLWCRLATAASQAYSIRLSESM